jgi:hypothetical protein
LLRTLVAETVTPSFEAVAPNAEVAPAGVLPRQAKDEDDDIARAGHWARLNRGEGRSRADRRAPVPASLQRRWKVPRVTTKQSCERGQQSAGGLDLSGTVFNGQGSQTVAFVVLRMDAGDDLTFAISVDGRGRESWAMGLRFYELLDERCSWS